MLLNRYLKTWRAVRQISFWSVSVLYKPYLTWS